MVVDMTGFDSKRDAAADKLQDSKCKCVCHDGCAACDARAQPAQEPVAWITPDGEGFRIRFSAPTNDVPLGWDALYTTPPKREWVGLTPEETSGFTQHEMTVVKYVNKVLREKNA